MFSSIQIYRAACSWYKQKEVTDFLLTDVSRTEQALVGRVADNLWRSTEGVTVTKTIKHVAVWELV